MNIASTIARYLLGILFTVFGANGFLHFIAPPPPSTPFAGQFMTVVSLSHFMVIPFLLQLLSGIALLTGRFVPLALIVLAAIIINILDFHITMDLAGIAPGAIATILWLITAFRYRETFRDLVQARPAPSDVRLARRTSPAAST